MHLKREYQEEKTRYLQERRENYLNSLTREQNIWRIARSTFRSFTSSFRGLKTQDGIEIDPRTIANKLGDFFEKHK